MIGQALGQEKRAGQVGVHYLPVALLRGLKDISPDAGSDTSVVDQQIHPRKMIQHLFGDGREVSGLGDICAAVQYLAAKLSERCQAVYFCLWAPADNGQVEAVSGQGGGDAVTDSARTAADHCNRGCICCFHRGLSFILGLRLRLLQDHLLYLPAYFPKRPAPENAPAVPPGL